MNTKESLVQLIESTDSLHKRFDIPESNLTQQELDHRLRIQMEELGEFAQTVSYEDKDRILAEATDVAVVAIGTLLLMGDKAISAIEKIIAKNGAKTEETHRFDGGKIVRLNK